MPTIDLPAPWRCDRASATRDQVRRWAKPGAPGLLRRWLDNAAARRRLERYAMLDRRFTQDIGLTSAELATAVQAPFWIAPQRLGGAPCTPNPEPRNSGATHMEAVYRVSGQHVETGPAAAGPWHPSMQHGAAPAALIAWAAEHIESDAPMRIARLTLDLLRPVPVAPLEIRSAILRQGRKSQVTQIMLLADGVEVVRASVLKLRRSSPPLPRGLHEPPLDLPGPELSHELCDENRIRCPFLDGVAARLAGERERRPGPTAMWFRAFRPIIEGDPISPAMRAAIAADFCNGVSSALDMSQWSFINADVTLSLARLPVGEWILVNAETSLGPDGGGVAVARLGDTSGYFGRAAQSLVIERR